MKSARAGSSLKVAGDPACLPSPLSVSTVFLSSRFCSAHSKLRQMFHERKEGKEEGLGRKRTKGVGKGGEPGSSVIKMKHCPNSTTEPAFTFSKCPQPYDGQVTI